MIISPKSSETSQKNNISYAKSWSQRGRKVRAPTNRIQADRSLRVNREKEETGKNNKRALCQPFQNKAQR